MEGRMFNLLQNANDDQTAIGLCVLVLTLSAFLVFVSFHVGPAGRKRRSLERQDLEWNQNRTMTNESYRARDRAA